MRRNHNFRFFATLILAAPCLLADIAPNLEHGAISLGVAGINGRTLFCGTPAQEVLR